MNHKDSDMTRKIPITKPFFDEEERRAIVEPLETGWVVQGPNVAEFEKQFANHTGAEFACATSNCTTALHLALLALGVGDGDEVVVPAFTYVASQNSVEYCNAKVVFCDVDLATFNIDVNHLQRLLEADKDRKIKAIMPVSLFGLGADMVRIMELAKEYDLKVVEDSACAFDTWVAGKHSGTMADAGCFSFHPRKAICTGEGGMLITSDPEVHEKVRMLKDHGASKSDLERHQQEGGSLLPEFKVRGHNYRMTDFQGALGVCQMKKAEYIMGERRRIAAKYDEALKVVDRLITPVVPEGSVHGYQSYVCLFSDRPASELTMDSVHSNNVIRNRFMTELEKRGIATRQGTHAVHTLEYYQKRYDLKDEDFFGAYAADRLSIAIPVYAGMSDEDFDYVIDSIKEVMNLCAE